MKGNGKRQFVLSSTLLGMVGAIREQRLLILDTLILGVVGALSAQFFSILLRIAQKVFLGWMAGYQPPGLPNEGGSLTSSIGSHGLWLIPVVTTLGGLITGLLVYSLAPEAEGHGTDAAVKAFHRRAGLIRARIPWIKMVASAITLGSGGAAGREGPTALISAGVGSIYATLQKRTERERRLLVLIGMASGLAAIFRSPIGTAFFAIEVLYGGMEFEAGSLLYTMLGSIVAYAVNGLFSGYTPLFQVPAGLAAPGFIGFLWYVILGIAAGLVAAIIPTVFYGMRDLFAAIPIPPHFKPGFGGLGVGLLALQLPQVLGGGYGWIQLAILGRMPGDLMLILVFAMILAYSLTISSGGSGGVFAPSLFVGAMLGGFLGQVFHQPAAAFVVVGMAAVFGGAARVPIATLLMVTEMTGGYTLLVPAGLAVMLCYLVQVALTSRLKYKSLYEAQVTERSESPAHQVEHMETALDMLARHHVVMPNSTTPIDLRALMVSGIPIQLPDEKIIVIGVLKATSPFVRKDLQFCYELQDTDDFELIAVVRQGHTILPHPNMTFQAGDRFLCLTTQQIWKQLASNFAPLKEVIGDNLNS
ncbi:MAG: chloride channel protein [Omnitrophica WOR_2 bacterium]